MSYYPHSQKDTDEMLKFIGKTTISELCSDIPEKVKIKKLNLDTGKSELETFRTLKHTAGKNRPYSSIFLGAGAYNHYIPAAVDELSSRQEFYTAYTPYQPEISQGTLRAIFEYQSYITELTGMDVSNASMYDGASALAEAVMMAVTTTRQRKVLVDKFIHPEYLKVLRTYLEPVSVEIEIFKNNPFKFEKEYFKTHWNSGYACFVVGSPNYFGTIYDIDGIAESIHSDKRFLIQTITEALSLTIFKKPSELGVDIVCGEAQSFGIPLSFGGPYLGFLACKSDLMRKMPGRIAGQTDDKDGKPAYILTLTAREQHIRRELASSNICSNHGWCALRAAMYISVMGRSGLKSVGLKNIENTRYLKDKIKTLRKFSVFDEQLSFNEFVVKTEVHYKDIKKTLEQNGILSFKPLCDEESDYTECSFSGYYLVCATEMNTIEDIDGFVKVLEAL